MEILTLIAGAVWLGFIVEELLAPRRVGLRRTKFEGSALEQHVSADVEDAAQLPELRGVGDPAIALPMRERGVRDGRPHLGAELGLRQVPSATDGGEDGPERHRALYRCGRRRRQVPRRAGKVNVVNFTKTARQLLQP